MRTTITLILAVLMSLVFAVTSFAAIEGTAHDLSNLGSDQICIYCHTPHDADTTVTLAPLWNAEVSVATFGAYDSSTFGGVVNADPVIGPSRLCMSCHDGTVAIDSAIGGDTTIGDAGLIGPDLTNDHPIGFDYVAAQLLDDELELATSDLGGATIADFLFSDGTNNNIMTCSSCHDVHGVGSVPKFLLEGNGGSALCLQCHIK